MRTKRDRETERQGQTPRRKLGTGVLSRNENESGLEAEEFAVPAEVSEKMVKSLNEWDIAGPAERSAHALAGAHVALWKRCAAGDKPLLILEDGLLLPQRLPQITAHLTACVERVTAKDEGDPALLLLGAAVNPMGGYKEPWLPTDLQHEQGDKVVLREVGEFLGAFAYILWPFTARRLLASLPVASATDAFLTRCVASGTVRALVVQPALAVPRTDEYMPATRYRVVHTRVARRKQPAADAFVEGATMQGAILTATRLSDDKNWIMLPDGSWVMIRHPELGTLLELLPEEDEDAPPFGAAM